MTDPTIAVDLVGPKNDRRQQVGTSKNLLRHPIAASRARSHPVCSEQIETHAVRSSECRPGMACIRLSA